MIPQQKTFSVTVLVCHWSFVASAFFLSVFRTYGCSNRARDTARHASGYLVIVRILTVTPITSLDVPGGPSPCVPFSISLPTLCVCHSASVVVKVRPDVVCVQRCSSQQTTCHVKKPNHCQRCCGGITTVTDTIPLTFALVKLVSGLQKHRCTRRTFPLPSL